VLCAQDDVRWWWRQPRRLGFPSRLVDAHPRADGSPPCQAIMAPARIRCRRGRSFRNRGENTKKLRLGRTRRGGATARPVHDGGGQGASTPRRFCSFIVRHGVDVQLLILLHACCAPLPPPHATFSNHEPPSRWSVERGEEAFLTLSHTPAHMYLVCHCALLLSRKWHLVRRRARHSAALASPPAVPPLQEDDPCREEGTREEQRSGSHPS
jgi:hypothetical protein